MQIVKEIITNILVALYEPFWFALILSVLAMFFYLYCYRPVGAGKGMRRATRAWLREFAGSARFRRLFLLVFCTAMILFRTLLNRSLWLNPLSNVMDGWWIWKTDSSGKAVLTTECFENVILMMPFTFLLLWAAGDWILERVRFSAAVWTGIKTAAVFSLGIELCQLLFRLGTFQLSDLCYNTLGGGLGERFTGQYGRWRPGWGRSGGDGGKTERTEEKLRARRKSGEEAEDGGFSE